MPASGNVKMGTSWLHCSAPAMSGPVAQAIAAAENPYAVNHTLIQASHFATVYMIFGKFQKVGTVNANGNSR